jgi:hypothetical protein
MPSNSYYADSAKNQLSAVKEIEVLFTYIVLRSCMAFEWLLLAYLRSIYARDNLRGQKSLGPLKMSLEMAHKVILPPKKIFIPQFLKQRDINS